MAVTFSPAAARDVEEIGDYIHAETQLRLGVFWPRSEYGVGALPTHRAAARSDPR